MEDTSPRPGSERPTILVVDDEELSREFVRAELESDHRILAASTAEEALRIVDTEPVDLVLLDVVMPGIGGFEACKRLKGRMVEGFLPILFLTARKQLEDRYEGLVAGGDDFLTKPMDSKELRLRIRSYLRLREQDRTIRAQARTVERANDRLRAIAEIGALLSSSLRLGEPHGWVVEAIAREFRLELAAIGGPGPLGASARGVAPASEFERAAALLSAPEAARSIETGRFVLGSAPDGARLAWVPILDREGAFGILVATSRRPGALDADDARALTTVCSQLALTLRNREFVARVGASAEPLESAAREKTASLERQIHLASQILDALPVSLYVVDRNRTIVAWNRQRELGSRGVLREQALGKSLFEVFDRQSRESVEEELRPVFDHGETLCFERDTLADGQIRHYRIHKVPMWLDRGDVSHVLNIGEDITEERRLEETLAAAEKMAALGRLANGVAHEIDDPLKNIAASARELGLRGAASGAGDLLATIQREATRASRITEDLLDLGRRKESPRRATSLAAILERSLEALRNAAGFEQVEVARHLDADLPEVEVDEEAIVQVLVALFRSALDAVPGAGRLAVSGRHAGGEVRCELRNTGRATETDRPHVFEPWTASPTLSYGIVEAHGGRIEADHARTCFRIHLPAARASLALSRNGISGR
jgi:PAS domain S-box-containing protein